MSKKVYVRLGEKADSFSEPTTNFKLNQKGEVKELPADTAKTKRVLQAISGGHLEKVTEEDYNDWLENQDNTNTNTNTSDDGGGDEMTVESLKDNNDKLALIAMAVELIDNQDDDADPYHDEESLEKLNKTQLAEFIIANQSAD